jgi:excisionase family DNA binding protein
VPPTTDPLVGRRLLRVEAVADALDLTHPQVYRLVREGRLPAVSIGRYLRFDPVVIQRWIETGGTAIGGAR